MTLSVMLTYIFLITESLSANSLLDYIAMRRFRGMHV